MKSLNAKIGNGCTDRLLVTPQRRALLSNTIRMVPRKRELPPIATREPNSISATELVEQTSRNHPTGDTDENRGNQAISGGMAGNGKEHQDRRL
jgi:hypothetical protein